MHVNGSSGALYKPEEYQVLTIFDSLPKPVVAFRLTPEVERHWTTIWTVLIAVRLTKYIGKPIVYIVDCPDSDAPTLSLGEYAFVDVLGKKLSARSLQVHR